MDELIPKCIGKCKELKIAKTVLGEKERVGGFMLPDFKTPKLP